MHRTAAALLLRWTSSAGLGLSLLNLVLYRQLEQLLKRLSDVLTRLQASIVRAGLPSKTGCMHACRAPTSSCRAIKGSSSTLHCLSSTTLPPSRARSVPWLKPLCSRPCNRLPAAGPPQLTPRVPQCPVRKQLDAQADRVRQRHRKRGRLFWPPSLSHRHPPQVSRPIPFLPPSPHRLVGEQDDRALLRHLP